MPLPFPVIKCPSERDYRPGTFPVREFVARNGAVTKIALGDRISDASLTLTYPYIPNVQKALVIELWKDSVGGFRDVALPANAFEGDPELEATIPTYLSWFMGEPQTRTPRGYLPGFSLLTLAFNGRLMAS